MSPRIERGAGGSPRPCPSITFQKQSKCAIQKPPIYSQFMALGGTILQLPGGVMRTSRTLGRTIPLISHPLDSSIGSMLDDIRAPRETCPLPFLHERIQRPRYPI